MTDLVRNFGDTVLPELDIEDETQYDHMTDAEMRKLLDDPHSITVELAKQMAFSRPPYGYAIMITKDKQGFVIGTSHKNDVSMFMKPSNNHAGGFWQIHAMTGNTIRDPQIQSYLRDKYDLYDAVQRCVTRLQEEGDSQIMLAGVEYAKDFARMRDSVGSEHTVPHVK
jgi:hypothetical protein